jgi:hypothetical protein
MALKKPLSQSLREDFLAWQCRIRQIACREDGGRPSPGMRPRVRDRKEREIAQALTVLLLPEDPSEALSYFRHQLMRSADPRDAYERGLAYLSADFFQEPGSFGDRLFAILAHDSEVAATLIGKRTCVLEFEQWRQGYRLPCTISLLKPGDPAREAAVWHNRLFNPALPETVHVLAFQPDWASAGPLPGREGQKALSS